MVTSSELERVNLYSLIPPLFKKGMADFVYIPNLPGFIH